MVTATSSAAGDVRAPAPSVRWYATPAARTFLSFMVSGLAVGFVLWRIVSSWDHILALVGTIRSGGEVDLQRFGAIARTLAEAALAFTGAARVSRETFRVGFALAAVISTSLLAIGVGSFLHAWGFLFCTLPVAIIVRHAVYERTVRRLEFEHASTRARADGRSIKKRLSKETIEGHLKNYDVGLLTIRFGLPAFILVIIGTLMHAALWGSSGAQFIPHRDDLAWVQAARLGAIGAYTYVITTLGQRAFRRDITQGMSQWSGVMLVLGPLTAGIAALAFEQSAFHDGTARPIVTMQALYFIAGLSPRYVAVVLEETVRRLLSGKTTDGEGAGLPLTRIRGITRLVAERLEEEGLFDVHMLAHADPLRLLRNTNFDRRQIASWIDQALLIHGLPHLWEKLAANGIHSAVDVAYRYQLDGMPWRRTATSLARIGANAGLIRDQIASLQRAAQQAPTGHRNEHIEQFLLELPVDQRTAILAALDKPGPHVTALGKMLGLEPEPALEMVDVLYNDMHVDLVWALYNMSDGDLAGDDGDDEEAP